MNFFELSDLMQRDVSDVHLTDRGHEITSNFIVDGKNFEIKLQKSDVSNSAFGQKLFSLGFSNTEMLSYFDNVYYLSFKGPTGYRLGSGNTKSAEIYGNVLRTLKKLKDERGLDGLKFSAFDPSMQLVYERFLKSFTDFQLVSDDKSWTGNLKLYLSKSLLDQLTSRYPELSEFVNGAQSSHSRDLRFIRFQKNQFRKRPT